jgi:hypothetical protein
VCSSVHPAFLWEAINVLRLRVDIRNRVGSVLSACRSKAPSFGAKVSKGMWVGGYMWVWMWV